MPKPRPLILLTRPKAQAERFQQELPGMEVVISPLMRIEPLPMSVNLESYRGLIFTSENGVSACGSCDMPAYCVGARTAKAAKASGMQAMSADGTADDLIAMIKADHIEGPLLHIRGEHTRGDVAMRSQADGLHVDDVVGYRQVAQPLTMAARAALSGERAVILPLFSPRTATLFFDQAGQIKAPLRIVVLSAAVGGAVHGDYTVADSPDAAAMVRAIKGRMDA